MRPPLIARAPRQELDLEALQAGIDLVQLVEQELGIRLRRTGSEWRGQCPKHESSSRLTLNVNADKKKWTCRSCGAGGDAIELVKWHRGVEFREALAAIEELAGGRAVAAARRPAAPADPLATSRRPVLKETAAPRPELEARLAEYEDALAGSPGEAYLAQRRIPLAVARRLRVGYAAYGAWAHEKDGKPVRQWRPGRIVGAHEDAAGAIVNLYGRAVGDVPEQWRDHKHDHLAGKKGIFNGGALASGAGPVVVCEGMFDALAVAAAGVERVVACFGLDQWPWRWARGVESIVLVLDQDAHEAGQTAARDFAAAARMRGVRVALLPPDAYGGCKDVAEAWGAGALDLEALAAAIAAVSRPDNEASQDMAAGGQQEAASARNHPEPMSESCDEERGDIDLEDTLASGDAIDRYHADILARAAWFLCDQLASGSRRADEVAKAGAAIGLTDAALRTGRAALGVEAFSAGGMSGLLRLPAGPCRCHGADMPPRPA